MPRQTQARQAGTGPMSPGRSRPTPLNSPAPALRNYIVASQSARSSSCGCLATYISSTLSRPRPAPRPPHLSPPLVSPPPLCGLQAPPLLPSSVSPISPLVGHLVNPTSPWEYRRMSSSPDSQTSTLQSSQGTSSRSPPQNISFAPLSDNPRPAVSAADGDQSPVAFVKGGKRKRLSKVRSSLTTRRPCRPHNASLGLRRLS